MQSSKPHSPQYYFVYCFMLPCTHFEGLSMAQEKHGNAAGESEAVQGQDVLLEEVIFLRCPMSRPQPA